MPLYLHSSLQALLHHYQPIMTVPMLHYRFTSVLWKYPGPSAWHFVSLPEQLTREIREALGSEERGWGRLPAQARIADSAWQTAIWYDSKRGHYLLPLKAGIRKRLHLAEGDEVTVEVSL